MMSRPHQHDSEVLTSVPSSLKFHWHVLVDSLAAVPARSLAELCTLLSLLVESEQNEQRELEMESEPDLLLMIQTQMLVSHLLVPVSQLRHISRVF
jgi:hypothetical protein